MLNYVGNTKKKKKSIITFHQWQLAIVGIHLVELGLRTYFQSVLWTWYWWRSERWLQIRRHDVDWRDELIVVDTSWMSIAGSYLFQFKENSNKNNTCFPITMGFFLTLSIIKYYWARNQQTIEKNQIVLGNNILNLNRFNRFNKFKISACFNYHHVVWSEFCRDHRTYKKRLPYRAGRLFAELFVLIDHWWVSCLLICWWTHSETASSMHYMLHKLNEILSSNGM